DILLYHTRVIVVSLVISLHDALPIYIASNGVLLGVLSYVVFLIFGSFFSKYYFLTQTNDPQIIEYGTTYLRIISMASIGLFIQITRSEERRVGKESRNRRAVTR